MACSNSLLSMLILSASSFLTLWHGCTVRSIFGTTSGQSVLRWCHQRCCNFFLCMAYWSIFIHAGHGPSLLTFTWEHGCSHGLQPYATYALALGRCSLRSKSRKKNPSLKQGMCSLLLECKSDGPVGVGAGSLTSPLTSAWEQSLVLSSIGGWMASWMSTSRSLTSSSLLVWPLLPPLPSFSLSPSCLFPSPLGCPESSVFLQGISRHSKTPKFRACHFKVKQIEQSVMNICCQT